VLIKGSNETELRALTTSDFITPGSLERVATCAEMDVPCFLLCILDHVLHTASDILTRHAIYGCHNIGARSRSHSCRGKIINNSYSECASVALVIHHAKRMRRIVFCDLSGYTTFFPTLSHNRHDSRKKVIEQKMWVLIFSTNFL